MLELAFISGMVVGYLLKSYLVRRKYKIELESRAPRVKNPKTKQ